MGLVLTTGVQGIIAVIINLSPEGLSKTSSNVSNHRIRNPRRDQMDNVPANMKLGKNSMSKKVREFKVFLNM